MGFLTTRTEIQGKPGGLVPFKFKYTGSEKIERVTSSCGCTTPTYFRNPLTGSTTIKGDVLISAFSTVGTTSAKLVSVHFSNRIVHLSIHIKII